MRPKHHINIKNCVQRIVCTPASGTKQRPCPESGSKRTESLICTLSCYTLLCTASPAPICTLSCRSMTLLCTLLLCTAMRLCVHNIDRYAICMCYMYLALHCLHGSPLLGVAVSAVFKTICNPPL